MKTQNNYLASKGKTDISHFGATKIWSYAVITILGLLVLQFLSCIKFHLLCCFPSQVRIIQEIQLHALKSCRNKRLCIISNKEVLMNDTKVHKSNFMCQKSRNFEVSYNYLIVPLLLICYYVNIVTVQVNTCLVILNSTLFLLP